MSRVSNDVFGEYRKLCWQKWGVTIEEKSESRLMRTLSVLLFFNRGFMTDYVTTIGKTVYWPNADKLCGDDFTTLFHEAQHVFDFKKNFLWFTLSYLFPQVLAIFSLMVFLAITGNLLWLLSFLWLLVLLPLPAPMRTRWELRGYGCTMAYDLWTRGEVPGYVKDNIKKNFTSSAYYFMWPFSRSLDWKLGEIEEDIREGVLTEVQRETGRFLVEYGVAVKAVD